MITVNHKPKQAVKPLYKKGDVLQSTREYDGGRNYYLVLSDQRYHDDDIHTIRLVSSKGEGSDQWLERNTSTSADLVELFHGELVIKNG